jgi:hypothetical protein
MGVLLKSPLYDNWWNNFREETHMVLIEAKVVDSTHLELSKPITANRGKTVFVAVAEFSEKDVERQQWLARSAAALQAAYGASEPDYTPAMVKENNP